MTSVPGSMPRIILDCFCKRRIIFGADLLLNKNIKILLNYILGPLVFLFLSYSIYRQILRQPNWRESLDQMIEAIKGPRQWRIWLVLALMPLNWGIEARKWQLALRRIGGIRYQAAFRAILTGTTLASFTPNRVGEYLGRILYVEQSKRLPSISLTIVCSIAQLLITLMIGIVSILFIRPHLHEQHMTGQKALEFWLNTLLILGCLFFIGLTFVYFRLPWLVGSLERIPGIRKWLSYVKVLEDCDATILSRILFLSFLRYLVFIVQYALIFPLFGVFLHIPQVVGGMGIVFLVMAVVPTFTFLTELGLRWGASIQILELFGAGAVGIFAASLAIWLINLIIPALIGSLLILSIKPVKSK
jgi:hypothetical protein